MLNSEKLKLAGFWEISRINKNNPSRNFTIKLKNQLTITYQNNMLALLTRGTHFDSAISVFAFGTGQTMPQPTDTALENEIDRILPTQAPTVISGAVKTVCLVNEEELNDVDIYEVGVFFNNASTVAQASDKLMSRCHLNGIRKNNTEQFIFVRYDYINI